MPLRMHPYAFQKFSDTALNARSSASEDRIKGFEASEST